MLATLPRSTVSARDAACSTSRTWYGVAPTVCSPPDDTDDLRLWQDAVQGNADARQRVVERAIDVVRVQLRPFTTEVREELCQRIATAVLLALQTGLLPDSNLNGFLHWRGRAQITAYIRELARRRELPTDDLLALGGHSESPLREIETADLRHAIQNCIDSIPNEDHRSAFRRRFVDGQQPIDIGNDIGHPAGRIRVWLARAASLVRRCLERHLGNGDQP